MPLKVGRIEQLTHTPGPWKAVIGTFPEGDPRRVEIMNARGVWIGSTAIRPNTLASAVANGRLMAAAPELLEACRALLAICDEHLGGLGLPGVREARTAIAKAEGRS